MNKHTDSLLPANERLKMSLNIMRALAHPLRLEILHLIDSSKESNVGEIYKTLKIEQALASQQLRILRQAGLVTTRRDKKFVYYSVNYPQTRLAAQMAPLLSEGIHS